jgi:hypothetical protein
MKRSVIAGALAFLLACAAQANADVIPGPFLDSNVMNQTNSGVELTAITDSVLQGFIYQNQGGADLVELAFVSGLGISGVVGSIPIPAGNPSYTVSGLSWNMQAGTTYVLVATGNPNNGKFGAASYPVSDSQISVITGVFSADLNDIATDPNFWGDFNDITTSSTSSLPEPGSLLLASFAVAMGSCGWRFAKRIRPTR